MMDSIISCRVKIRTVALAAQKTPGSADGVGKPSKSRKKLDFVNATLRRKFSRTTPSDVKTLRNAKLASLMTDRTTVKNVQRIVHRVLRVQQIA